MKLEFLTSNRGLLRFYGLPIFAALLYLQFTGACLAASTFGFSGEEADTESGLIYLRARYYDPSVGLFINKDPLGIRGGLNSYSYANANPVNSVDPSGKNPVLIIAGVAYLLLNNADVANAPAPGDRTYGSNGVGGMMVDTALMPVGAAIGKGVQIGVSNAAGPVLSTIAKYVPGQAATIVTADGTKLAANLAQVTYNETMSYTGSKVVGASTIDALAGKISQGATPVVEYIETGGGNALIANTRTFSAYARAGVSPNYVAGGAEVAGRVENQLIRNGLDMAGTPFSLSNTAISDVAGGIGDIFGLGSFGYLSSAAHDVGGVLIDKAATLIGSNLNDIKGATFDPVSKQIVFLGSGTASTTTALNMDYFYTAVQAVYGSAVPPFVTLDPPASMFSQWTDSNGNGVFENNEVNSFVLRYNPLWSGEDTTVDIRVRASWNGTNYDFTVHLLAQPLSIYAGGRQAMGLVYSSATNMPSGLSIDTTPFTAGRICGSMSLNSSGQDSYWPVSFTNQTGHSFLINSVAVIPGRQHRKYGGRVDDTKLGWVMYEADRVMKCLAVGKDNLTGTNYNSSTISISGYKNLLERCQAAGTQGGDARMWFIPNEMTLQRYVDPVTGQATIAFDKSTVALLTESYMQGLPQDPNAQAFATHFQQNYDAFAALSFPVMDPNDSTGQTIINVPIFAMLKEAMQAVSLARFFRDNNIPLDMWWLNSWQPPKAYSPKSVATAYNQSGDQSYVIYGGVQIQKPNSYIPSATAQSIGQAIVAARPADSAKPTEDIKQQSWSTSTALGSTKAVAASMSADSQIGNVKLAETDLSFASPGELPLEFTRYYQSSWLGASNLGPGWRNTRYVLQFSAPSWYDENHLMKNGSHSVSTDSKSNTRVRSGTIQMVDLLTGAVLDFKSSMVLTYSVDGLGNPYVSVSGLTSSDVPTFTAGKYQSGATMFQTGSYCDYYVTMADGSYLVFDYNGYLLQTSDRHGWSQWYDYNSNTGLLSTISDAAGQAITLTYSSTTSMLQNASGPRTTGTNIQSVTYDYDAKWRLKSVTHDRSQTLIAQYTYNDSNQLQDVTRMDGLKPVTTTPDVKGRSSTRKNARGNSSTLAFYKNTTDRSQVAISTDYNSTLAPTEKGTDSTGRTTYVKDALNNYTLLGYDDGNSVLPNTIQLPLSADGPQRPPITIKRNAAGLPKTIIDPTVSGSTQVEYTSANFPWKITDTEGRKTEIDPTYTNNVSKVRRFLNGQALETSCGYNYNDYLTTVTDPLNHTWTYGRDTVGRLTSVTDPSGVKVSCDYDGMGRLWHIYDPKLSNPITYDYDELDRIKTVTTPTGTTSYVYDPVTKRLQTTTENTADGKTRAVVYGYDNNTGDVTSTTYKFQTATGGTTSVVTSYGYTDYGDLNSVTPPGAAAINFNINEVGQLLSASETNVGLTVGPTITASSATSGVWTNQANQLFFWGAPPSSVPITGYNYAEDASTALTVNTTNTTITWNGIADGQSLPKASRMPDMPAGSPNRKTPTAGMNIENGPPHGVCTQCPDSIIQDTSSSRKPLPAGNPPAVPMPKSTGVRLSKPRPAHPDC